MQEKPMFLKFGRRWVNLSTITHIDFYNERKTATVYAGAVPVLEESVEAFAFFQSKDMGFFFTQPVG